MASLRLAMDAAFWDLNVSSTQNLEGTARSVPGEPVPLGLARSSRTLRPQQLSFLANAFPLGLIPSFAPTSRKDVGSFAIQSLLLAPASENWWMGLVGQFRPRKLISSIKKEVEVALGDELEWTVVKDVAKHFLDKSLYSLGLFSQFSLTPDTSILFNVEKHGDKKGRRTKAMLLHKLPGHDITVEAAWPELFVDSKGNYWDVPNSVSVDVSSLVSDSGLRYRFGLHKNGGQPEALSSLSSDIPLTLMPGVCAKAAFSYEKSMDLWREKEKIDRGSRGRRPVKQTPQLFSYDERLKEPHAAISGIFGGTCSAWFGGDGNANVSVGSHQDVSETTHSVTFSPKRKQFNADMFGSLLYTLQLGKFREDFNDLTRIDARLDIYSASSFMKGVGHLISDIVMGRVDREVNPLATPRLNLILQQQVAGPIVFRMDSRVSLGSLSGKPFPHVEDIMFGLSYSFRLLKSGKLLAWFSPKRKEAMVELRLFEF
ncbi:protein TRIGALACTOSYLDIACYLGLYCEROL 4, chloroplastic [Canna indica]|uniref:Protein TRIGALACTOSYLDIACYLGLYCEROL 4, chloroplastic n=1 Tax=Canna indica TaxID=4628 RepID=A0AAQ3JV08_9LILI|nr:protein TRIGALACTOSYLDIACYLGLYCEROL 4, chloroplastic [Canna indica]